MRQAKDGKEGAEDAKRARNEVRVLALLSGVVSGVGDDDRKDPGSNKGTNLADCSRDSVVLATNRCCACFSGKETDIVTRTNFTKGKKDPGYHCQY